MATLKLNRLGFPSTEINIDAERKLLADRLLFWFFVLTAASIFFQFAIIGLAWSKLPPQIPLFYSKPWGEDILSRPLFFWVLPGFSVLVFVINFILSILVSNENKFLNRIFAFASLFVSLAILFDIFKIITLLV